MRIFIRRLNRTNSILEELRAEKKHYASTCKKYNKVHKALYGIQLLFSATSVTTGGWAIGSVASGIGVIAAVPLGVLGTAVTTGGCAICSVASGIGVIATVPQGVIGMISRGVGIVLGIFDQIVFKKMKKHSKLVQLCQTTDSEMVRKYVYDQQVTKDEITEILKMIDTYYVVKDDLREKKSTSRQHRKN